MGIVERFWFPLAPASRLAAIRIAASTFALGYYLLRAPLYLKLGRLDDASFTPVGVLSWLAEPLPSWVVVALLVGCWVTAALNIMGTWSQVTGPLLAGLVLFLATYRSSWGMVFHSENLLFWHLAVLGCARAGDIWVVRFKPLQWQTSAPTDNARYGWPWRLLLAVTLGAYFLAGVAKLRGSGISWAEGELLLHHVAFNGVRKLELGSRASGVEAWLIANSWALAPLSTGSLLIELGAPLALVHRRALQWWAIGAFAFHWGIYAVMAIPFHYPLSGLAFAAFLPLDAVIRAGGRVLRRAVLALRVVETPPRRPFGRSLGLRG